MPKATTSVIHDIRRPKKSGTFPVKLRVTYQGIQKYFPLGYDLTILEWDKTNSPKPRDEFKDNKMFFNKVEAKALKVARSIDPFSFEGFKKVFNKTSDYKKDAFDLYEDYIKELRKNDQPGTANNYESSMGSFKRFNESLNRKKLNLGDITAEWLTQYERWMVSIENKKSQTTVGVYTRSLRAIINYAIEEGLFNQEFYPFGKRRYQIPASRNIKKALSSQELKELMDYSSVSKAKERARDMFFISLLCNGANFKDIANLKYSNINGNTLVFIREKTKRTTKTNIEPIIVSLIPESIRLIKKWGIPQKLRDDYVFGIIDGSESEENKMKKVKQATKVLNKHLKLIGEELGFTQKITLGVARYTWATRMVNLGASEKFIGDGLGHQQATTTKHYIGSLDNNIRESFQNKILNFDEDEKRTKS